MGACAEESWDKGRLSASLRRWVRGEKCLSSVFAVRRPVEDDAMQAASWMVLDAGRNSGKEGAAGKAPVRCM